MNDEIMNDDIMDGGAPIHPVPVGLDDGYAYTKLALPDDRFIAVPSRGRTGRAGVTWIDEAQHRVFEYETQQTVYSVGTVDGVPTRFEGYSASGLNRVIVQHALQEAGLAGRTVHAVSGLPVSTFYQTNGTRRTEAIAQKQNSLKQAVTPLSGALAAGIAFHEVIPEALAAWYDYVILDRGKGAALDPDRMASPVAIIDIGGRTTDYVVVQDQGIVHASSGSLTCGLLDVAARVAAGIRERFDLETLSDEIVSKALQHKRIRLQRTDHDVTSVVQAAQREVVERIHSETRRQLGRGMELECILFVGGGTVALVEHICDWFPHQAFADNPAFANARGMLKYLRYVCEADDAA